MSVSDAVADRFVTFRDGLVVPVAAYLLLLDLERRGCHVLRDGEALVVGPSDRLNDEDRGAIRRWRWHLLMLVNYCQQPGLDAHLFTDAATKPSQARADDRRTA